MTPPAVMGHLQKVQANLARCLENVGKSNVPGSYASALRKTRTFTADKLKDVRQVQTYELLSVTFLKRIAVSSRMSVAPAL